MACVRAHRAGMSTFMRPLSRMRRLPAGAPDALERLVRSCVHDAAHFACWTSQQPPSAACISVRCVRAYGSNSPAGRCTLT
eukprot:6213805-Pleurochrysis_carterae.AAC.5